LLTNVALIKNVQTVATAVLSGRRLLAYQLILRKIIKTVATRCQIFRLKCTQFDFGWGSAPDPAGGAYSTPRPPIAAFEGAYI